MPRMALASPYLLVCLVVAAFTAIVYAWTFARRRAAEAAYSGRGSLRTASWSSGRRLLKAALVVSALACLGLAIARPQVGTRRQLLQREGTDIIIALDVSLSMTARDAPPTRLDRARGAIGALLDHLQGDRIGLVTFAGSAALRFPLTTDLDAARAVVNSLGYKDGGLQAGTTVATALRQATEGFANDRTRSKILLLVSDGDTLGDDAASAASFVRSEGITLDTLGVGATSPVPVYVVNPRTLQLEPRIDPATGQPLLTAADPKALQQLAAENHGRFYNVNTDDFAVQLADEVGRLQKTRFDSGEGDLPIERFQVLVAIAILLLLIEFVLPAGRPRRGGLGLRRRLDEYAHRMRGVRQDSPAADPSPGGD